MKQIYPLYLGLDEPPKPKNPEWKWRLLTDVAKLETGHTPSRYHPEYWGGDVCWVSITDVTDNMVYIYDTREKTNDLGIKNSSARILPKGTVLMSRGPTIGKTCIFSKSMSTNQSFVAWVPSKPLDSKFLFYAIKCSKFYFESVAEGATMKTIYMNAIKRMKICMPNIEEQQKVVSKLDKQMEQIEMMKKEAEKAVNSIRDVFKSYLKDVFESDKLMGFPKVKLKEITTKIGSGITPRGGHSVYQSEGTPLIRSMNIHLNEFKTKGLVHISKDINQSMKNTTVTHGDVLLNITGASIGRVCVVPDEICPANVNQHVSIIRTVDKINPYYLSYYLSTPNFQKYIFGTESGATRQALTKSKIEEFIIPLPPIRIQNGIVKYLNEKKRELQRINMFVDEQLNAISQLPSSILNEVFGQYKIPEEA